MSWTRDRMLAMQIQYGDNHYGGNSNTMMAMQILWWQYKYNLIRNTLMVMQIRQHFCLPIILRWQWLQILWWQCKYNVKAIAISGHLPAIQCSGIDFLFKNIWGKLVDEQYCWLSICENGDSEGEEDTNWRTFDRTRRGAKRALPKTQAVQCVLATF